MINRFEYKNDTSMPNAPEITEYTLFSLNMSIILFAIVFGIHVLCIWILKKQVVKNFTKNNFLDQFLHCVENTNFSFQHEDWDFQNVSLIDSGRRFWYFSVELMILRSTTKTNYIYENIHARIQDCPYHKISKSYLTI